MVSISIREGEIHAIVGENGAGKSTLMNILSGVFQPDTGNLYWKGKEIQFKDPRHAQEFGIAMIHQELSLAPHLSVTENVYLGRLQRNRLGFVDYRAMNRKCADQLSLLGIASIGPKQIAKDLSAPQRQVVEIAKALSLDAKLLIMDEPTASLTAGETETLFIVIRKLKAAGVSVIFISHRLQEVFELSDRITVLRDGRHVRTLTNGEAFMSEIVGLMVGRDFTKLIQRSLRQYPDGEEPLFEVRHLSSGSLLKDISFKIFRGEVVALTGLVGSGRTELMHSIFGIAPKSAGEILVEGKRVSISSPRSAIAQGLGLVPEERKEQGLFLNMTVKENISMAHLPSLARFLFLQRVCCTSQDQNSGD
jgi:ABC-type sugar transport system ATPase subunit